MSSVLDVPVYDVAATAPASDPAATVEAPQSLPPAIAAESASSNPEPIATAPVATASIPVVAAVSSSSTLQPEAPVPVMVRWCGIDAFFFASHF